MRTRVDGQLLRVAFREGQLVRQGDLLAEIDPRPFQVQLEQAQGQLGKDTAMLQNARVLEAFEDVEDNLAAVRLLFQESEEQARAVAAAERALTLAQNRYQGGITSYLEVVTAQTTALANERTGVDLQTRRRTASLSLIKALGGGWSDTELPEPGAVLAKVTAAPSP